MEEKDRYKTAFVVYFGHYEWNVMPQELKNAPTEFQNSKNEIFNPNMDFTLIYLDDVLVFSKTINQHFDHLEKFYNLIKENSLVVSAKKMKLFQPRVRSVGYEIRLGTITPTSKSIEFTDKFPDEIRDKNQLQ